MSNDPKINSNPSDSGKSKDDPTNATPGDGKHTHVSQVVYLMPESYNALRRELESNWNNLWQRVGYYMAFNSQVFIHEMDEALDLVTQFDSANVDGICKRYLDELRIKRGLSRLHNPSEYHNNAEMEAQVRAARWVHENVSPATGRKQ